MTLDAILNGWEDYDVKKRGAATSIDCFDSNADWEVKYLVKKIKHVYPFIPDAAIQNNIKAFSKEVKLPCSRNVFVKSILIRLKIPL